jgi:hypothetical protein
MAGITLSKWAPLRKNTLPGFAEVSFGPSLLIRDLCLHTKNGRSWASLPSKPMLDRDGHALRDAAGKIRYVPILSWTDKTAADRFSEAVVAEVIRIHGAAVLDDEALA